MELDKVAFKDRIYTAYLAGEVGEIELLVEFYRNLRPRDRLEYWVQIINNKEEPNWWFAREGNNNFLHFISKHINCMLLSACNTPEGREYSDEVSRSQ